MIKESPKLSWANSLVTLNYQKKSKLSWCMFSVLFVKMLYCWGLMLESCLVAIFTDSRGLEGWAHFILFR